MTLPRLRHREDAGLQAEESEAVGVATARAVEAAVDRIVRRQVIRLGAWVLGVVGTATAIIIAVIRLSVS